MDFVWIIGLSVGLVIAVIVLAAALRSMRPKPPVAPSILPPRRTTQGASPLNAEIDRLLTEGQKIQAIKLLRDNTGIGLKEAKDRVEQWVPGVGPAAAPPAPVIHTIESIRTTLPAAVVSDIDELIAGGAPIVAIKALREHTGLGLKESKELIDQWVPGPVTRPGE